MSTGRRRSKWDQPAPLSTGEAGAEEKQPVAGAVPPPAGSQPATDSGSGAGGDDGEAPKVGSQAEAARAAARLNAMLAAQGKLGSGEMPPIQSSPSSVASSIRPEPVDPSNLKLKSASVDINDSPSRIELMKASFLAEINKKSGAILAVRGRYMPALEKEQALQRGEKALHIHIQAPQQSNVDLAVKLIAEATAKARAGILNLGQQAPPFFPSGQHYVQDKVFIGLDQAPEEFHLNEKLQGPGNSYFEHIMSKTKARIHLRGRGSGYMEPTSGRESFEALYIYLQHSTPEGLKEARTLCDDLVKHVQKEYGNFKQQRTAYRPPFPYTPFPGYGPMGYFGPPTNPGPFQVPPPPGYFPPPHLYSGSSYPDPNAAYSFPPGGYHGYNLPPASCTGPAHPPIPESTETSSDKDKDVSEKEEPAKRKFTEKPLPEVKSADSKKPEVSIPDGEQNDRGSEKESGVSVGNQEDIVDHKVVEGCHLDQSEKDDKDSLTSSNDNCGPSQEAQEPGGPGGSSLQPPPSLMLPPRIPAARIVRIGQKRQQVEEDQAESQPEVKKVSPRAMLVLYDSDSDSEESDTP